MPNGEDSRVESPQDMERHSKPLEALLSGAGLPVPEVEYEDDGQSRTFPVSVTQEFDERSYLIDLLTQVAPGAAFVDLEHMRLVVPVQRKLLDVPAGRVGVFMVDFTADDMGVLRAYVRGGRHARNDPNILDLCERILATE